MGTRFMRAAPSALIAGIAAAVIYGIIAAFELRGMGAGLIVLWAVVLGVATFIVADLISVLIATWVTRPK